MQKCESLHRPLKRQIYSSAYCAGGSQHFISQSCWGLPLHLYCCFNTISGRIAFLVSFNLWCLFCLSFVVTSSHGCSLKSQRSKTM
ncbi:hypothetical protein OUZ56_001654 [Daphnia magna]|uniref:Uncharacterized protein n=1 Tax=Daphnia magna TaxID=35525 RepID=A0ABR0A3B5_9CRUS|nr:hypothetical protein OUZ56_001654 [Daphnia magna]